MSLEKCSMSWSWLSCAAEMVLPAGGGVPSLVAGGVSFCMARLPCIFLLIVFASFTVSAPAPQALSALMIRVASFFNPPKAVRRTLMALLSWVCAEVRFVSAALAAVCMRLRLGRVSAGVAGL